MKYITKQYFEKSLKTIESEMFIINDRAKRKDELLYQDMYHKVYHHYCDSWGYKLTDLEFIDLLNSKIDFYKERLPEYITSKIADIRITAMGVVSQEIYYEIYKYNDQLLLYCENVRALYRKNHIETIKYLSDKCKKSIECNLYDSKILKYELSNNKLRL